MSDTLPYGKEVDIWAAGCIMGEIIDGNPLFPGESEMDQLYVIQKVLGPLPHQMQDAFNKNPRFVGLRFPDVSHPETLKKKYTGKASSSAIDLMSKMLLMDPERRISAMQALSHDYFNEIREPGLLKNLRPFSPQDENKSNLPSNATTIVPTKKTASSFSNGTVHSNPATNGQPTKRNQTNERMAFQSKQSLSNNFQVNVTNIKHQSQKSHNVHPHHVYLGGNTSFNQPETHFPVANSNLQAFFTTNP